MIDSIRQAFTPALRFACLIVALTSVAAESARLSIVVSGAPSGYSPTVDILKRNLEVDHQVRVYTLGESERFNPVAKGRFLAQVSTGDWVIPIGDPATQVIADELDNLPTFFVNAATLRGGYLSQQRVSGVLAYSFEQNLRVAKLLLPQLKTVGLLYSPGYEGLMEKMKASIHANGVEAVEELVTSRKEVGPAVRSLVARCDLLWIMGDPLLTQGLAFEYLLQISLPQKKPLFSPVPELVAEGALFCVQADPQKVAHAAAIALGKLLGGGLPEALRIQQIPGPGGSLLLNRRLCEKWNLSIPAGLSAQEVGGP